MRGLARGGVGIIGFVFQSDCCAIAGEEGKTTADVMEQSTFTDWDFINVWARATLRS